MSKFKIKHAVIIAPWLDRRATVSLFDDLEITHHVVINYDVYCWMIGHMIDAIYAGEVVCHPTSSGIGSNHYHLTEKATQ